MSLYDKPLGGAVAYRAQPRAKPRDIFCFDSFRQHFWRLDRN
jgi:hypothetical protein